MTETREPPPSLPTGRQDASRSDGLGEGSKTLPDTAPPRDESFPRSLRLTREAEFRRVLARGFRHTTPHLVIHLLANELGHARLGLTVPRKVGTAVLRNRVKRRVREAFRRSWRFAAAGHPADIVVRALPGSADVPFEELSAAGLAALEAWRRSGHREGGRRPRGARS